MPAERVSMRKIREALRLTHAMGMSRRLVGSAITGMLSAIVRIHCPPSNGMECLSAITGIWRLL